MFNKTVNYEIVQDCHDRLLIRDLGPWDQHLTVTNGAEIVVEQLAACLNGRKLDYIDSDGDVDQLVVKDGKFAGFARASRGR